MSTKKLELHCFGNQWSVLHDVIKSEFNMPNDKIFSTIKKSFIELESKLEDYSINYSDLKSALIPPDGKKHFDFLFLYDYSKCDECFLRRLVFEKLFRIFDYKNFKETNTSIFSGDLLFNRVGYKEIINYINKDNKQKIEPYKSDYFVVLMSNLTENQSKNINDIFENEEYYICYKNITFGNNLAKVNLLLPSVGLKAKDKFIMSVPEECGENFFSDFLPKGIRQVFIIDYLFDSFLTYNYHTNVYYGIEDFTNYILNPNRAENFKSYSLVVDETKHSYLTLNKSHVLKKLFNGQASDLDDFKNVVRESLSNNIFNIRLDIYGVRFNTLIDVNEHRLFFAFEYISKKKEIRLITAY